jgi:hypothetical protein
MSDFSFVKHSVNPQTADETTMVLAYEVAKVVESIWGKDLDSDAKTYGKTECADVIAQCRMLCEQECWYYEGMIPEKNLRIHYSITFNMMHIAMGNIIQRRHYHKRFGGFPKGDPKQAMEDLITSVHNLAYAMNWNYSELEELGETRYKERMIDLKEHGIQSGLKEEYRRSEINDTRT